MRSLIYKLALFAVVVCVFIVLVAPDIDLPDSTVLRVRDGFHLVVVTIDLAVTLLLSILLIFSRWKERKEISTRLPAPTCPVLCVFLC
jgi:hypothetical protein